MSDAEDGVQWERTLPDAGVCRARIITGTLVECLVQQPWECPSAISFGYSHICMNPDRSHIVARTRPTQAPDGP